MKQDNLLNKSLTLEDILSLFTDKKESVKSLELDAFLNFYLKIRELDTREETRDLCKTHMKLLFNYFKMLGVKETKDINQDIIDSYIKYSITKGNKAITINKRLSLLNTMFNVLVDRNLLSPPNFTFKKLKETKSKIPQIKVSDVQKIIDYMPQMELRHRVMFMLLLSTGIRRNELVHIKISNINFKDNSIFLEFTKTGVSRYCYFTDTLGNLIKDLIIENKNNKLSNIYLFATADGHWSANTVTSYLYYLKNKLKIDILSPHKLRHLFATTLLNNGADLLTIKELLGHSSINMTQKYLDISDNQIKNNLYKFNPLNNFSTSNVSSTTPHLK